MPKCSKVRSTSRRGSFFLEQSRADKRTNGASSRSRRFLLILYLSFVSIFCFGTYQVVAEGSPTIGERFKDCAVCPEMIVIPAGEFVAGDDFSQTGTPDLIFNVPQMFAMAVYETTIADWENCEFSGKCRQISSTKEKKDNDFGWREWKGTRPMVNVSWEDSVTYAIWLSSLSKENYWLPTELEWEYAARSEIMENNPWLGLERDSCNFANLWAHDGCSDRFRGTAPVGSYTANRFGLYDMIGNVSEWTASCWGNMLSSAFDLVQTSKRNEFEVSELGKGMQVCDAMVYRGANWSSEIGLVDFSTRKALGRETMSEMLGFRVVRSIQ